MSLDNLAGNLTKRILFPDVFKNIATGRQISRQIESQFHVAAKTKFATESNNGGFTGSRFFCEFSNGRSHYRLRVTKHAIGYLFLRFSERVDRIPDEGESVCWHCHMFV